MLKTIIAVIGALIFIGSIASAEEPASPPLAKTVPAFTCTAETEGQLSCQAGKSCKCGFKPAEAGTGLPARWAWDCGVMRPQCDVVPADTTQHGQEVPAVIVELKSKKCRKDKKECKKDNNEN